MKKNQKKLQRESLSFIKKEIKYVNDRIGRTIKDLNKYRQQLDELVYIENELRYPPDTHPELISQNRKLFNDLTKENS